MLIKVFEYHDPDYTSNGQRTSGGVRLTFDEKGQHVGTIEAPEGTAFDDRSPAGTRWRFLRVPGHPDPRLTAREATELAREGAYGLSWVEAGATSGKAVRA